jgi:hypothetical protein
MISGIGIEGKQRVGNSIKIFFSFSYEGLFELYAS